MRCWCYMGRKKTEKFQVWISNSDRKFIDGFGETDTEAMQKFLELVKTKRPKSSLDYFKEAEVGCVGILDSLMGYISEKLREEVNSKINNMVADPEWMIFKKRMRTMMQDSADYPSLKGNFQKELSHLTEFMAKKYQIDLSEVLKRFEMEEQLSALETNQ